VNLRPSLRDRGRTVKRFMALLLSCALVLSLVVVATAQAHDAPNRCGHKRAPGAGWYKLRGHNTNCKKARRVARRWERRCVYDGQCPRRRPVTIRATQAFRCRYKTIPNSDFGVRVRCLAVGERVVHFRWAA
jgi:hypothetical protein